MTYFMESKETMESKKSYIRTINGMLESIEDMDVIRMVCLIVGCVTTYADKLKSPDSDTRRR